MIIKFFIFNFFYHINASGAPVVQPMVSLQNHPSPVEFTWITFPDLPTCPVRPAS